jgi:hypothetical protein
VTWRGAGILTRLLTCLTFAFCLVLQASQLIPTDSPIGFFTNVAGRLLHSELNLELDHLQIYPTNQYTPAAHRLLQVTANLYDCTTNRTFGNATSFPYCPSLFRPIFRQTNEGTNWVLLITGYREVVDTSMANSATAPIMVSVEEAAGNTNLIPILGTPPNPSDRLEPMIRGVPVIVATRKGFPNFNEFSLQTYISVSRLLEFRRALLNGPVTATNQMYTLTLSNTFGLEAWNSYSNPYPRNLQLLASVDVTTFLTNVSDTGDGYTILSNRVSQGIMTNISAGSWPGWTNVVQMSSSFLLPLGGTNSFLLANASYLDQPPFLQPLTHTFAQTGLFSVPRIWLNLNVRLLFVLVDADAARIIDYVNLDDWEPTLDVTGILAQGADCSGNAASLNNPMNQWCTNRVAGSNDSATPTIGVVNQIALGLGFGTPTFGFLLDPYSGLDLESAIDGFRFNLMGWAPMFPKDVGKTFYRSNVFYVPSDPYMPLYLHTTLQANDPLVHYMTGDLTLLFPNASNLTFYSSSPPLPNLGQLNDRYEPWGGNPFHSPSLSGIGAYQITAKDPLVSRSDMWNFPTNQALGFGWVGQVHRGTPWETIFLKSTNVLQEPGLPAQDLVSWQAWTGNNLQRQDWKGGPGPVADALYMAPTNDWQLVSRLAPLFNTNDVRSLVTVNQDTPGSWSSLLDGLLVVTNPAPGEMDSLTISSNSSLARAVGQALAANQAVQHNGLFAGLGDILATPELSVASPWLTNSAGGIDDRSVELIPSQLLSRLRPDSWGSVKAGNPGERSELIFNGFDDYTYSVQRTTNLVNWTPLGTFTPTNGSFSVPVETNATLQFYRSFLVAP